MSDADDYDDVSSDASGQTSLLIRQTSSDTDSDLVAPLTYLQLGARPTWGTEAQRGDDLLAAIGLGASTTQFFKDDHRSANDLGAPGTTYTRDDGNTPTTTTATALTSELMTRGGFRLHTDGNLVSTTRGDRVDVVGGNHKLIVLGRTNASTFVESSGGHAVREDASTHARFTSVEWNASRSTWTTYEETLKGNHTSRFQGPLETIFECDAISDTIGRAVDDEAEVAPTIPAATAAAHQQTDAAEKWVNPSSGCGTGWPRAQESPTRVETIDATSYDASMKVTSGMGSATSAGFATGKLDASRTVDVSRSRSLSASQSVSDVVRASKGAHVTEAIGFKSELVGGTDGAEHRLNSNWRCRFFVGGYEGAVFETRSSVVEGGSNWLGETILDVVGVHVTATTGVRLIAPNFSKVSHPAYTKGAFYTEDGWSGMNWLGELIGSAFFGTGDTEIKILVPTLEYSVVRAAVNVCHYKARANGDHLHAHLVGAHTEIGIGKVIGSLFHSAYDALKSEVGAWKLSMAAVHAKS